MSYFEGLREARRFTEICRAPTKGRRWRYAANKLRDKAVADTLGIRSARIYATYHAPEEVDLASLPDRFALKATNMASGQGVFLLHRQNGRYRDLRQRRAFSEHQLLKALLATRRDKRKPFDAPVIAEELLIGENGPDQIPFDYKFYVFDGQVEFIVQMDRNISPPGIAWFGRDFAPLDPACIAAMSDRMQPMTPRLPRNWQALLDAARRISLHIDTPYISVDLYTDGADVIFGELTAAPGGPYFGMWRFSDAFDADLGAQYLAGLARRDIPVPIVEGLPPVLRRHQEELAAPTVLHRLARRARRLAVASARRLLR